MELVYYSDNGAVCRKSLINEIVDLLVKPRNEATSNMTLCDDKRREIFDSGTSK